MNRKEMYRKMKSTPGYGVVRTFDDGSKLYYFYEVFSGQTYKDTFNRIKSHGHTPENSLILRYNDFFDTISKIDKVYTVSDDYAKEYDLYYKDRIQISVIDAPVTYAGATTIDCAFSY